MNHGLRFGVGCEHLPGDEDSGRGQGLAEVDRERRTGSGWYGSWPRQLIERDFPAWKVERREWFTAPEAVEEIWSIKGTHLRVVAQRLPEGGLLLIFEDRTRQFELQREHGEMQQVRTATLESLAEAGNHLETAFLLTEEG